MVTNFTNNQYHKVEITVDICIVDPPLLLEIEYKMAYVLKIKMAVEDVVEKWYLTFFTVHNTHRAFGISTHKLIM